MLRVKVGFISYELAASIRVRATAEVIYLAWKVIVKLASTTCLRQLQTRVPM